MGSRFLKKYDRSRVRDLNATTSVFVYMIVIGFMLCGKGYSQSTVSFGLNVSTGLKRLSTNANGKRGIGADVEYVQRLWAHGGIIASAGIERFDYHRPRNLPEDIWSDSLMQHPANFQDLTFVPVRLGLQEFISGEQAYVYAVAGIARLIPSRLAARNVFSYSLGAGYRFPLKTRQYLQLSVSYNYNGSYKYNNAKLLSNHNYLSLAVAYGLRMLR